MSEIKVNSIKGVGASAAAITVNNTDGTCTANITNNLSNRRLTINGAMTISQRGTSFTTPTNDYTLDRFSYFSNIDTGRVGVTQESVTDLTGFTKAAKINCTTAETGVPAKAGSKFAAFRYFTEAQDLQHLAYGTSGAKTITLSFYVKSNITGTFCVSIYKNDQTARNVSLGYTISSANTWEKKTLTYPADTGGGGIDNNNGQGLQIYFVLARQQGYQGTASTTWANNTDARFANLCTATIFENTNDHIMFTGVQLEVGSVATDFEHRSFAQELALCQRYYQVLMEGSVAYFGCTAYQYSGTLGITQFQLTTEMRVTPTLVQGSGTNYYKYYINGTSTDFNSFTGLTNSHKRGGAIYLSINNTQGTAGAFSGNDAAAKIHFAAEL